MKGGRKRRKRKQKVYISKVVMIETHSKLETYTYRKTSITSRDRERPHSAGRTAVTKDSAEKTLRKQKAIERRQ